jgi:hypothetical protein
MGSNYYHPDSDFYRKTLKVEPPSATAHVTEEDMIKNMKQLKPNSWVLRGNQLEGMTEMGKLVQTISSDYICTGTDEQGLPKLQRVLL